MSCDVVACDLGRDPRMPKQQMLVCSLVHQSIVGPEDVVLGSCVLDLGSLCQELGDATAFSASICSAGQVVGQVRASAWNGL